MALKKEFVQASGVKGDYWSVQKIALDKTLGTAKIFAYLWLDEAARKAGKPAISGDGAMKEFHFEGADATDILAPSKDVFALAYEKIKKSADFKDATDI